MTYGANDMALDNWGIVDRWIARDNVTTLGASGIGFVNFGSIDELRIEAPIETFGPGARGFNVYTGSVRLGIFDRIVAHGDGAVGVQISQTGRSINRPARHGDVWRNRTIAGQRSRRESPGQRPQHQTGRFCRSITIEGGLRMHGAGIVPLEQQGIVDSLTIDGGFRMAETGL